MFLNQNDACDDPEYICVYAVVAPFPTTTDSIPLKTLEDAWAKTQEDFNNEPLLMTQETYHVFVTSWGNPILKL